MPGPPGQTQRAASKFVIFENFKKLNTAEVRQGLPESDLAWVENLQPIADNNWTTVPGPGNQVISTGATFISLYFGVLNISNKTIDFIVGFTSAGGGIAVNVNTDYTNGAGTHFALNTAVQFAPNGTFSTVPGPDMTSWQNKRFLFNDSVAGYCSWDGTTFTRQGGVSANITVTNGGSGYTSPPSVTISGGSGSGATAVATIGAPAVVQVILDAGGSGYTSPPTVGFTGGGGSGASATTSIDPRAVLAIQLDNGGAYARDGVGPYDFTISFSGGGGSGAAASYSAAVNGAGQVVIYALTLTNGGSGYSSAPTITITPNIHLGTIFAATAHVTSLGDGRVTAINFDPSTQGGSGYTSTPTVTISGGGGSGASAHAVIGGAQVTGITLTNPGSGYLPGDTLTVTISGGGGTGATATAKVAPFIPKGTSVAVFQGRVWLNFYTGPNSTGPLNGLQWSGVGTAQIEPWNDWDVAHASGALVLPDTDLVHQITGLRSFNNFLWIIGDQSIKQIGNIALNQSGTVTLFTILTLSSDQGTTFLRSCVSFNRVFFFVNQNGIYAVFGSSVQKVSGDLDGIFRKIDFSQQPQGALADMNNIHNVVFLLKYNDTIFTNTTRSLLALFNGQRWFLGSQGDGIKTMTHACSVNTTWTPVASTGGELVPLFYDSNVAVNVRLQTALTHHQNPVQRKKTVRLGYAMILVSGSTPFSLQLDSNEASQPLPITLAAGFNLRTVADPNVSGTYLGWTIGGVVAGYTLTNLRIEYQETNVGNQN